MVQKGNIGKNADYGCSKWDSLEIIFGGKGLNGSTCDSITFVFYPEAMSCKYRKARIIGRTYQTVY